jgi:hypothetical protein
MNCSIVTCAHQFTAVVKVAVPFTGIPEAQRTARARLAAILPSLATGPLGSSCTRWAPPAGCRWKSA